MLATVLYHTLKTHYSDAIAKTVASEWCNGEELASNCRVALPFQVDGKGVSLDFINALRKASCYFDGTYLKILPPAGGSKWVTRKDDAGFWTIYNRTDGTNYHIYLDAIDDIPIESNAPIKVYLKGDTFSISLDTLINRLTSANVLEVCLVSLETSSRFHTLIKALHEANVSVSLEVSSTKWMSLPIAYDVFQRCVHITYRTNALSKVLSFNQHLVGLDVVPSKISIGVTLGNDVLKLKTLLEGITSFGYAILLYGHPNSLGWDVIKNLLQQQAPTIFASDLFFSMYGRKIQLHQLSGMIKPLQQGKFSCVIDLPTMTMQLIDVPVRSQIKFSSQWVENYKKLN